MDHVIQVIPCNLVAEFPVIAHAINIDVGQVAGGLFLETAYLAIAHQDLCFKL